MLRKLRRVVLRHARLWLLCLYLCWSAVLLGIRRTKQDEYITAFKHSLQVFDYIDRQRKGLNILAEDFDLYVPNKEELFPTVSRSPLSSQSCSIENHQWYSVNGAPFEIYLFTTGIYYHGVNNSIVALGAMDQSVIDDGTPQLFCHFPMGKSQKAAVRQIWLKGHDPRVSFYVTILIACSANNAKEVAISYGKYLDSSTKFFPINTPIQQMAQSKRPVINLCVKGMDFLNDISDRLIEWFEINRLLGANHFYVYVYAVQENVMAVLRYYHSKGIATVIPLTLPGHQPNDPFVRSRYLAANRQQKRRNEILPYNDCLFRSSNADYILPIDIDEVIFPLEHSTWQEMITSIASSVTRPYSALSVRNVFFFDRLTTPAAELENAPYPPHTHMLRHTHRSVSLSPRGEYEKAFLPVPLVASVFNHYALHKTRRDAKTLHVNPEIALKLHYKSTCPIESRDACPDLYENTVKDDIVPSRLGPQLLQRISEARTALNKAL